MNDDQILKYWANSFYTYKGETTTLPDPIEYLEGRSAYLTGFKFENNPYMRGTISNFRWSNGFLDAQGYYED